MGLHHDVEVRFSLAGPVMPYNWRLAFSFLQGEMREKLYVLMADLLDAHFRSYRVPMKPLPEVAIHGNIHTVAHASNMHPFPRQGMLQLHDDVTVQCSVWAGCRVDPASAIHVLRYGIASITADTVMELFQERKLQHTCLFPEDRTPHLWN